MLLATTKNVQRFHLDILDPNSKTIFRLGDYSTTGNITALAAHIEKKLIFVADTSGTVRKVFLDDNFNPKKPKKILRGKEDNLTQIHHLSVDWLNDKLYVCDNHKVVRCDINHNDHSTGGSLETVIDGFASPPSDLHIDPLNGYLFFTLNDQQKRGGLYRVDLSKLTGKPIAPQDTEVELVIREPTIGLFAIDYTNFRVYYPKIARGVSTVIAAYLDGKYLYDIREEKIETSHFYNFKSIAHYNNEFYWTNGTNLYREEHNPATDKYHHNEFGQDVNPYVSIRMFHPSVQPYPTPPESTVRNLKSRFEDNAAVVVWDKPSLVSGRSQGSWQNWHYELRICNTMNQSDCYVNRTLDTPKSIIVNLTPETTYEIHVRAWSPAGNGKWSERLTNKTLASTTAVPHLLLGTMFGKPSAPEIKEADLNSNIVTWSKAEGYGASRVYYELYAKELDEEHDWQLMYNGSAKQWFATNLSPERSYNLKVRAQTEYGYGPYSKKNITFFYRIPSAVDGNDGLVALFGGFLGFFILLMIVFCIASSGKNLNAYE